MKCPLTRIPLPATFFLTACVIGCLCLFTACQSDDAPAVPDEKIPEYYGLRQAAAADIQKALPEVTGHPTLIYFTSRFCSECKQLKPRLAGALQALNTKHPEEAKTLVYKKLEIQEDQKKYKALFLQLQPITAPTLVYLDKESNINAVQYGLQTEADLYKQLVKVAQKQYKSSTKLSSTN